MGGDKHREFMIKQSVMMKLVHSHNPGRFVKRFGACSIQLQQFWHDFFDSRDGASYRRIHPHLRDKSPYELRFHLPFMLHEDAAPAGKTVSSNGILWGSLLGCGEELQKRFFLSHT